MRNIHDQYANLLTNFCLQVKEGDRVFVRSTYLAEPLLIPLQKAILEAGGKPVFQVGLRELERQLLALGNDDQLSFVNPLTKTVVESFEAYLFINAPFNLKETANIPTEKRDKRQQALRDINQTYFKRTASGEMKRSLCVYPTQALAQEAGMSLDEYREFVFGACKLFEPNPVKAWLEVRKEQQRLVDHLNKCSTVRYEGPGTDITFSTEGRTWINSDGTANMPSGEVFTSPVEDSAEGRVSYKFPAIYMDHEVEGVSLEVKNGEVVGWEADRGKDFLDYFFTIDGAKRFGEIAIATNYGIDRFTKNILFDEKIGGTVHMALGQSYPQAGGENESTVHWDMIADFREEGRVYADGEVIFEAGQFLI